MKREISEGDSADVGEDSREGTSCDDEVRRLLLGSGEQRERCMIGANGGGL